MLHGSLQLNRWIFSPPGGHLLALQCPHSTHPHHGLQNLSQAASGVGNIGALSQNFQILGPSKRRNDPLRLACKEPLAAFRGIDTTALTQREEMLPEVQGDGELALRLQAWDLFSGDTQQNKKGAKQMQSVQSYAKRLDSCRRNHHGPITDTPNKRVFIRALETVINSKLKAKISQEPASERSSR